MGTRTSVPLDERDKVFKMNSLVPGKKKDKVVKRTSMQNPEEDILNETPQEWQKVSFTKNTPG